MSDDRERTIPYEQGKRARQTGLAFDANPYRPGSVEGNAWDDGYKAVQPTRWCPLIRCTCTGEPCMAWSTVEQVTVTESCQHCSERCAMEEAVVTLARCSYLNTVPTAVGDPVTRAVPDGANFCGSEWGKLVNRHGPQP